MCFPVASPTRLRRPGQLAARPARQCPLAMRVAAKVGNLVGISLAPSTIVLSTPSFSTIDSNAIPFPIDGLAIVLLQAMMLSPSNAARILCTMTVEPAAIASAMASGASSRRAGSTPHVQYVLLRNIWQRTRNFGVGARQRVRYESRKGSHLNQKVMKIFRRPCQQAPRENSRRMVCSSLRRMSLLRLKRSRHATPGDVLLDATRLCPADVREETVATA